MINPSIHGWIDKFFADKSLASQPSIADDETFYSRTRATGFIFGHIIGFDVANPIETKGILPQEISKLSMLNTLYQMYRLINQR